MRGCYRADNQFRSVVLHDQVNGCDAAGMNSICHVVGKAITSQITGYWLIFQFAITTQSERAMGWQTVDDRRQNISIRIQIVGARIKNGATVMPYAHST